jgi:hypothetical protein
VEKESGSEGYIPALAEKLRKGLITPEACAEALNDLLEGSLPQLSALLLAESVMNKLQLGETGGAEAEKRLRALSDLHPALPLPFLYLAYLAMLEEEAGKSVGYLSLYRLKKECMEESPAFGYYKEIESDLQKIETLWEEDPGLLSVWAYLEEDCDHLVDHFLLHMLVDGDFELEEDLAELLLEREESLRPLMLAIFRDYLAMVEYDLCVPPSRLDILPALLATREDPDLVPVFIAAVDVLGGNALNEAILALARLGARYPGKVSRVLRERAADPGAGEIRLAAVDALGILVGKQGNFTFLSRMLENLHPGGEGGEDREDADALFAFLSHAVLRSRREQAERVVREALASRRASLGEEAVEFVEDCLAYHARIRLGPSLRDITSPDTEDILFSWDDAFFRARRATLTLEREISLQEQAMADMPAVSLAVVEELLRTGRNEACFCGSGLKFKKCCLPRLEELRAEILGEMKAEETRSPFADVLDALEEFSRLPSLTYERTRAMEEFVHSACYPAGEEDPWSKSGLSEEGFFHSWFLLARPLGTTGKTVAGEFLDRHGNEMEPGQARYLKAAAKARFSFFEVREVNPGSGMLLRDLFRGDELEVRERTASRDLVTWDILGAFVGPVGEDYQLLGYGFRVPRLLLDWVEQETEGAYRRALRRGEVADMEDFLQRKAYVPFQVLASRCAELSRPTVITAEGDLFAPCSAVYDVRDREGVRRALSAHPYIEEEEEEKKGKVRFTWHMSAEMEESLRAGKHPGRQNPRKTFSRSPKGMSPEEAEAEEKAGRVMRAFAFLELGEERLTMYVHSAERLAAGKRVLGELLGELAVHRADCLQDQEALWEASRRPGDEPTGSEGALTGGESPLTSELEAEMLSCHLEKLYEGWLDEPIPYLDGLTPREAAASEGGRRKLDNLLKEYESNAERERRAGRPTFDFTRYRRELNIWPT